MDIYKKIFKKMKNASHVEFHEIGLVLVTPVKGFFTSNSAPVYQTSSILEFWSHSEFTEFVMLKAFHTFLGKLSA